MLAKDSNVLAYGRQLALIGDKRLTFVRVLTH